MKNEEYIECINRMLKKLDNKWLKKIFDYVQRIFLFL